jgi:hypothetical protein
MEDSPFFFKIINSKMAFFLITVFGYKKIFPFDMICVGFQLIYKMIFLIDGFHSQTIFLFGIE